MKTNSTHVRRLMSFGASTVALLTGVAGCSMSGADDVYQLPDAETLAAESQYMVELFRGRVDADMAMRVDLADDVQYRFVVHRLLSAGKTLDNSPQLFDELESTRERLRGKIDLVDRTGEASSALQAEEVGHAIPFKETKNPNGGSHFKGNVLINCKNGCDYAYGDYSLYHTNLDGSGHTSVGFEYGEDYVGGVNFDTVTVEGDVPDNKVTYQESLGYFSKGGDTIVTYALNDTQIKPMAKPALTITYPSEQYDSPQYNTDNDGRIRVCLMRGGTDCDFATVNAAGQGWTQPIAGIGVTKVPPTSPWTAARVWLAAGGFVNGRAYIPMVGEFDSGGCKINNFVSASARIFLIDPNVGHWGYTCKIEGDGSVANVSTVLLDKLKQRLQNPQQGDVDSKGYFDFLGDYGQDCYGYEKRVKLVVKIQAMTTCGMKSTEVEVQPIDFKNSCVAEGTRVLRTDGSYVAVEDIKAGDQIIADGSGAALTVRDVSRGMEAEPVIRMLDDQGHGLLITAKHPVVTESGGVVAAEQLRVGDKVRTEHGVSTIVSVDRQEYNGRVFNLAVGTNEELAAVTGVPLKRTMYANGFLVGDSDTQWELEVETPNMSIDPMSKLPSKWHQDYMNSLLRR